MGRLRALPWLKIGLGTVLALVVIGAVPPFRRAAAEVTSKVVLFVATPFAPNISGFNDLAQGSRVLAADGSEVGRLGAESREIVSLSKLPPHVPHAVLAAEDADFYHHSGVDPAGIVRAIFSTARGHVQGGSTITQQLAKLNYTGSSRTPFRKFKEVLYASKLERKYSKDELLERYLNQVYFGNGSYGIGVASATYFGVPPEKLDPAQAATLAGKIRAPQALDPYRDPGGVQTRRDQVLNNMRRHGWLTPEEFDRAQATPLKVVAERPALAGSRAPHFTAYVGREATGLDQLGGSPESRGKQVFTGGYTFETTLDVKALDAATAAAKQFLSAPGDPTTAIASVQPGDGAIRLLFGGLDPNRSFDVSSQGRRQPGSSFKPYVYLAMLDAGIDPRTTFDSGSPKTIDCRGGPWTVRNFEGEGGGPSTVDNAMTHSINTVFAQVMAKVGPTEVQKTAEDAGIDHDAVTPAECAMALGGLRNGVSPLEQANGFATFAAKGVRAQPYSIVRIRDRRGRVVYSHTTKTDKALEDKKVGVLNGALQDVVNSGTGTAAKLGRPVAGKTGTTENYGNAWFIGYVPQLSTAVWVGYPEGDRPMTAVHGISVAGGTFPARIFSRYMTAVLAGVPVEPLYTVSPDELNLRPLTPPPPAPPPTTIPEVTTEPPLATLPPPPPQPTTPPFTLPPASPSPTVRLRPTTTTSTRPPPTTVAGAAGP